MSDSRTAILGRIRAGLAGGVPLAAAAATAPSLPPPVVADQADRASLADRFADEAEQAGAVVHRAGGLDAAVEAVLGVLVTARVSRLAAWEEADLPVPQLLDAVGDRGIQVIEPAVPSDTGDLDRDWSALAEADAGLTGAAGGLADTGTVVLRSGPGRARLVWLLPPLHVVVLPSPFLYPTLSAFVMARGDLVGHSSHVALVTGPSRTADIEQTLTIGVHGPKQVHIVLLDDAV